MVQQQNGAKNKFIKSNNFGEYTVVSKCALHIANTRIHRRINVHTQRNRHNFERKRKTRTQILKTTRNNPHYQITGMTQCEIRHIVICLYSRYVRHTVIRLHDRSVTKEFRNDGLLQLWNRRTEETNNKCKNMQNEISVVTLMIAY